MSDSQRYSAFFCSFLTRRRGICGGTRVLHSQLQPVPAGAGTGSSTYGAVIVAAVAGLALNPVNTAELNAATLLTACKVNVYAAPEVRPVSVTPVVVGTKVLLMVDAPVVHVNSRPATLFLLAALLAQVSVIEPGTASAYHAHTMGFLVGCGRGHTHGVILQAAVKHPGHFFRNPEAGGGTEYTGIGHHRESVAKEVGVPGTYDYGPQRSSWMCSLITNWMGDAGVLKRVRTEMRRFNIVGDTTFCKGKVIRKYVKDRTALVDIEIAAENQRGEVTTPGLATVALPSRDVRLPAFIDGSGVDLELPVIR